MANQIEGAEVVTRSPCASPKLKTLDPRYVYRQLTNYFGHGLIWVPKHIWSEVDDYANFTFLDLDKGWPVGTGAWKLVKNTPNEIVLDRRDDWWGAETGFRDLPAPERIIAIPAPDNERNAQLVVANEIDATFVIASPSLVQSVLDQNDKITTFAGREPPYGYMDWWPISLYFNHMAKTKPFDNKTRPLGAHARHRPRPIDRRRLSRRQPASKSADAPATTRWMPYFDAVKDLLAKHDTNAFDPKMADGLLAGAGFEKDTGGFWAKDPSGKRVGVDIIGFGGSGPAMGPVLVEMFKRRGIESQPRPAARLRRPLPERPVHRRDLRPSAARSSSPTPRCASTRARPSPSQRSPGQLLRRAGGTPEFDKLVDEMFVIAPDNPKLVEIFRAAMEIWLPELPDIQLVQNYHRIPMNTTYWKNWPTAENPIVNGAHWHLTFPMVLWNLQRPPAQSRWRRRSRIMDIVRRCGVYFTARPIVWLACGSHQLLPPPADGPRPHRPAAAAGAAIGGSAIGIEEMVAPILRAHSA